jgi:hypothetical protein
MSYFFVIPGRAEGANPESRNRFRERIWIPGPLATRASRNDSQMPAGRGRRSGDDP